MSEPLVKIDVLNISANTPASMLTVPINISRLRKLITYIGIERVPQSSGNATGTVELYARWEAAMGF